MNVELRFLQKAIEDKNYISFAYKNQNFKKIKPLKLSLNEEQYYLHSCDKVFEFNQIRKIQISKERF